MPDLSASAVLSETPQQRWRRLHPERQAELHKKWRQTAKGKATLSRYRMRYKKNSRKHIRAVNSAWLAAHPEYERARAMEWLFPRGATNG